MAIHRSRKLTIKQESRAYFRVLGAHVTSLRKGDGMTQAELAHALGVSQQAVFAYELGERRISVFMLVKLAKIFGTTVEALIHRGPLPSPSKRRISRVCALQADRLQQLSRMERRFIKRIIDIFIREKHADEKMQQSRMEQLPNNAIESQPLAFIGQEHS